MTDRRHEMLKADETFGGWSINAGIIGMTRTLARAFGPSRIRVNAVAPGWALTERQKEIWGTVLFLSSNTSRMMTSQTLIPDGGYISG